MFGDGEPWDDEGWLGDGLLVVNHHSMLLGDGNGRLNRMIHAR